MWLDVKAVPSIAGPGDVTWYAAVLFFPIGLQAHAEDIGVLQTHPWSAHATQSVLVPIHLQPCVAIAARIVRHQVRDYEQGCGPKLHVKLDKGSQWA